MPTWQNAWYREMHDFSGLAKPRNRFTQLIKVTSALSGNRIRLALSNRYGPTDLEFDLVGVSLTEKMTDMIPMMQHGSQQIRVPQGQRVWLDPVTLSAKVGRPIYIMTRATRVQTYADFNSVYEPTLTNAVSSPQVKTVPHFSTSWKVSKGWFSVEQLAVWTVAKPQMVAFTGDSLMEMGMITTPIIQTLLDRFPNQVTFANTAISGNQLIGDAPQDQPVYRTFGPGLLKRIDGVMALKPRVVVATIGGNDLILPHQSQDAPPVTADQFMTAIHELTQRVADSDSHLILGTLPVIGQEYANAAEIMWTGAQINQQLLADPHVQATTDFLADQTGYLDPNNDFGDQLHLNPAAGKRVAEAFLPAIEKWLNH
ncbi:SGNH/GDSL hydrolase family protein [Levilactobacillus bambusae]|uniref:SGNH hydrolase-type esterase domain-containing protein n=1 Tax=Levilactobacillus bambusae TaxID=2024736 RepID=A0A2V1N225_9LACO|nr:GDSL-type esterase/lipase family protein [Levilactobacillus bambusae]PWG00375.1 hypothetical protein DCM90_05450 [Levilactobacillus bambusae]